MTPVDKTPVAAPTPAKKVPSPAKSLEMNSKNLRLVMLAALAVSVMVFFGIIALGMSALNHESQNMVNLKAQGEALNNQLLNLEQTKKDVEKYSYFKEVAQTVIPKDKDQAKAVLDIFQFAQDAGIRIQSITFPTSNLGGSAASQDATKSSSVSAAITQAKPVTGIPGLYSLPLTITPQTANTLPPSLTVTYPKILKFLKSIENNRRTAQITSIVIQPPTSVGKSLSFTLTINIFIKP